MPFLSIDAGMTSCCPVVHRGEKIKRVLGLAVRAKMRLMLQRLTPQPHAMQTINHKERVQQGSKWAEQLQQGAVGWTVDSSLRILRIARLLLEACQQLPAA
jgi:hypothetical protein